MRDVLLLVDVLDDFGHEHGEELLHSLAARHDGLTSLLGSARGAGTPVVFANDNKGRWDSDLRDLVRRVLAGPGGALMGELVPLPGERFVIKPLLGVRPHTPGADPGRARLRASACRRNDHGGVCDAIGDRSS